jgi:hypothetical protein
MQSAKKNGHQDRWPLPRVGLLETTLALRRVLLRGCQLALPVIRQVLDPAIVYVGDCQNSLPAIACQAADTVVSLGIAVAYQRNPACYFRIGHIAVIVGIDVNDDKLIGEFAGDIGIVSTTFFRTKICSVATWIAGKHLHHAVGKRVDDYDRLTHVGHHYCAAIRGDGQLDRKYADRCQSVPIAVLDCSVNGVIVGNEVDGF